MWMLAGIVFLHITTTILLLVATIDNAWWVTDSMSTELWGERQFKNQVWQYTNLKQTGEYLQPVQATSVLACVFTILALFVFLAQLFTLPKGQRFTFTGILQLIASLCIMIAASIYTATFHVNDTSGGYGHCFILAWISFGLTLALAITYLILRKKKE